MVDGIDLSSNDGVCNFDVIRLSNPTVKFIILRASEGYIIPSTEEGTDHKWMRRDDPAFPKWMGPAKQAGFIRGAYHFWRPDVDAALQRDVFLGAISADMGELPPTIDWEVMGGLIPLKPWDVSEKLRLFCEQIDKNTNKTSMIYTNPDKIRQCLPYLDWAKTRPLWIANPGNPTPWIPGVWNNYKIWQYTFNKSCAGVEAKGVDWDYFNGSLEDLHKFCGITDTPAPAWPTMPTPESWLEVGKHLGKL
jgi:lysozyme